MQETSLKTPQLMSHRSQLPAITKQWVKRAPQFPFQERKRKSKPLMVSGTAIEMVVGKMQWVTPTWCSLNLFVVPQQRIVRHCKKRMHESVKIKIHQLGIHKCERKQCEKGNLKAELRQTYRLLEWHPRLNLPSLKFINTNASKSMSHASKQWHLSVTGSRLLSIPSSSAAFRSIPFSTEPKKELVFIENQTNKLFKLK